MLCSCLLHKIKQQITKRDQICINTSQLHDIMPLNCTPDAANKFLILSKKTTIISLVAAKFCIPSCSSRHIIIRITAETCIVIKKVALSITFTENRL